MEAYCSDGLQSDSAPVLSSPDQAGRVTCQSSDIREVNLTPSGSLRWEQGMRDQPLAEWFMSLVNFWLPWADCPIDSWWRLGSNGYRKSSVSLRLLALERETSIIEQQQKCWFNNIVAKRINWCQLHAFSSFSFWNILEVVFINLKDESIYGVDVLFASNSFFDEYLE